MQVLKDNIEERFGLLHISFSEFSLFNQCPHKHLVYKHLVLIEQKPSIHLFFGNAVHESIEMSVKEGYDKNKRVKHFTDRFKTDMVNNMGQFEEFGQTEFFLEQGVNILQSLNIKEVLDGDEVISVEEPLYEPVFGKFRFKGFIDLNSKNKKRYKIVDWKTSGEPWDVEKKKKDMVFMEQMRLYKYFWARKHGIPLDDIDCRYVVLNRLKNKKNPNSGFGGIQVVDINSTKEEIFESIRNLSDTLRKIHLLKEFPKVKITGNERFGCMFCDLKGGCHPLCNSKYNQYVELLEQYKKDI